MLTPRGFHARRSRDIYLLKVISTLKILPLDVDVKHGILEVPSLWKRCVSFGLFGLFIIHGFYVNFRLAEVLLHSQETARHHLVFHVDMSLVSILVQGWYVVCYVLYPDIFVALFNDVFTVSGGHNELSAASHAPRKAWSRQELLALTMPMSLILEVTFILCVFTYDRRMACWQDGTFSGTSLYGRCFQTLATPVFMDFVIRNFIGAPQEKDNCSE